MFVDAAALSLRVSSPSMKEASRARRNGVGVPGSCQGKRLFSVREAPIRWQLLRRHNSESRCVHGSDASVSFALEPSPAYDGHLSSLATAHHLMWFDDLDRILCRWYSDIGQPDCSMVSWHIQRPFIAFDLEAGSRHWNDESRDAPR